MSSNLLKINLLLLLLLLLLNSCLSVKPSSTKSGKRYFETFYVGTDGTQYFIKPLTFKNEASGAELITDITFRYKNEIKDSAIINLSIKSTEIFKAIDSVSISNGSTTIKNNDIQLLFNEKNTKLFVSRFTTKAALSDLKELFKNNEWRFNVHTQKESLLFQPTKKSQKVVRILNDALFIIM